MEDEKYFFRVIIPGSTMLNSSHITHDLELNPDLHLSNQRLRDFYNSKYGEGHFGSKYPVSEKYSDAFTKPREWETFKYRS